MMKKYYYYLKNADVYTITTPENFFKHIDCFKKVTIADETHVTDYGWIKFVYYYNTLTGELIAMRKEILQ